MEKTDSQPQIPNKLADGLDVIYKIAEDVESVQIACMVAHDEFREKFKPGLVEVVFEWAGGMVSSLFLHRHLGSTQVPTFLRGSEEGSRLDA